LSTPAAEQRWSEVRDKFRPLDFLRTVTEDEHLSTTEAAVLMACAIGADNQTFKVRRSLTALGAMAKCRRDTVSEVIDRPAVARYLANVERRPRRVDISVRQEPEPLAGLASKAVSAGDEPHAGAASKTCRLSRPGMSGGAAPSASHLPTSASSLSPASDGEEEMARPDDAPTYLWEDGDVNTPPHGWVDLGPRVYTGREARYAENALKLDARTEGYDPQTGEYGLDPVTGEFESSGRAQRSRYSRRSL
jgi:hypothetical protein